MEFAHNYKDALSSAENAQERWLLCEYLTEIGGI
jgi:hypothetical protein